MGLEGGSPVLTPGVKPTETEQYTFRGDLNVIDGAELDFTGRICNASMDPSGVSTLASDDGTDPVRATKLSDLVSATMQTKKASTEMTADEKHHTVTGAHPRALTR